MSCIALVGGLTLVLGEETWNKCTLPLVAFAAGSLIGGAVFHMIPASVNSMGNVTALYCWLVAGFMLFFALEQFLNWHHSHTHAHSCTLTSPPHQHSPPREPCSVSCNINVSDTHVSGLDSYLSNAVESNSCNNEEEVADNQSDEEEDTDIEQGTTVELSLPRAKEKQQTPKTPITYMILVADAVHNFLGGLFVGASFVDSFVLGISAWLAAAAHEVPQELGDFAILVHGGFSKQKALLFNFLSALTFLIGGIVADGASRAIDVAFLIPFAAGNFLYIGASDLIPEVKHYHGARRNAVHFASFSVGIGIMLGIRIAMEGW
jgi:zinc transporter ZupT